MHACYCLPQGASLKNHTDGSDLAFAAGTACNPLSTVNMVYAVKLLRLNVVFACQLSSSLNMYIVRDLGI